MSESTILRLPEHVANQIAAGEVVARPSSVIKELLENAIDAGATTIAISIEGGGIRQMRVHDDGIGMTRTDALAAFERHATSKLRKAADLESIATLGFRGEALPSIASVSRLELQTRVRDHDAGTKVTIEGGAKPVVDVCGCAPGTIVQVTDLFFNVPARRKFMRAMATESAHISGVVRAMALAHPNVAVSLRRDGRKQRSWRRMDHRSERVRDVLSDYELLEVRGERGPVRVEGYLSRPERARNGAGGLHLFVNQRPIVDRALARAVANGYGEALDRGRYPVGVLYIDIEPSLVDVNVHPQKAEVRFAHARAVSDAVYAVVGDGLAKQLGSVPSRRATARPRLDHHAGRLAPHNEKSEQAWSWPEASRSSAQPIAIAEGNRDSASAVAISSFGQDSDHKTEQATVAPTAVAPIDSISFLAATAELWLCQLHDLLLVVDPLGVQHELAAGRMRHALAAGDVAAQRLLFPARLEVSAAATQRVERNGTQLTRLGFDVRPAGSTTVCAHAVPRPLAGGDPARLLGELMQQDDWGEAVVEPLCRLLPRVVDDTPQRVASVLRAWQDCSDRPLAERKPVLQKTNLTELRSGIEP